ncbi:MAG: AmmeMemoRadiSam system protein B [Candidatus Magasanikbacteria bacterium]|nr:AmmeMemoRadiSam system protein B [Candidatus Magasanikbacteria bacterium]
MLRSPAVAGAFYPGEPKELSKMIADFLAQARPPQITGRLRALIVPHAGYVYSGPVAAFGYKLLADLLRHGEGIDNFILLGPAHTIGFSGVALSSTDEWETPLGRVSLWRPPEVKPPFLYFDAAHKEEHCLEVQLPFLQFILKEKDFKICPLILGEANPEAVAREIEKWLNEKTLLIISSDLSHYHPYQEARELDKFTIDCVLKKQSALLEERGEACGLTPILTLLRLAHWRPALLDYCNSGDTAGDKERVVGYAAVAFSD